jgi:predicted TIM-barrel fold metal-dependent hydrolase
MTIDTTAPAPAPTPGRRATAIVDCDVHPTVPGIDRLLPYLSPAWRRRFAGRDVVAASPFPPTRYPHPVGFLRRDAATPEGGAAGTDPEHVRRHHVEPNRIAALVLLSLQAGALAGWVDVEESIALAHAYNAFFVEEWLPQDPRMNLSIVVSPHDPQRAAEEIAHWAGTERVVGVFLPLLDRLMGHRWYHPVYAAAADHGLPIVIHGSGAEGMFPGAPPTAGGVPATYTERYVDMPQIAQANVASLVFDGIFERFPALRVAFVEWGFSWLPALLWRMDKAWRGLRVETPWVRRPPSEYVVERIRLTTEPIDEPDDPRHLRQMVERAHGERTLMFSTDYPHWDNDTPAFVLGKLPPAVRDRVAGANARELFGDRLAGAW